MPTASQRPPRVALFTDTFYEANGVGTLSRHLARFAQDRELPFLVVRGGDKTTHTTDGTLQTLELKRGPAAFPLDKSLYCDPFLMRHKKVVLNQLAEFKPDLVHITGPGDLGFLGLWLSHVVHVPLVASWHTNLHEYLARRMDRALHLLPKKLRDNAARFAERESLRGLLRFYRTARFTLAPNRAMVDLLEARTRNPAFLMQHGVDLSEYFPGANNERLTRPFCIGYVGRLTTEKNIRELAEIERRLVDAGERNYQFLIVGEGGQQGWLSRNLQRVEFAGVLRGKALAEAYSRMDAFVFPSRTDTFGLVILEALASGIPVILTPETGSRVGIEDGVSGFLSQDFAVSLRRLIHDPGLRLTMGCAARKLAKSMSWSAVFEELYRTYAEGMALSDKRRATAAQVKLASPEL